MTMARYQFTVTDEAGNIVPGAHIEVRREQPGQPLATLKSNRAGTTPLANPFDADSDGFAYFHVAGGSYQVRAYTGASGAPTFERIFRYVAIGMASETDAVVSSVFDTVAEAVVADISSDIDAIYVAGHTLTGFGGAFYSRALSEPSHQGKFPSNSGSVWWELSEDEPTVEMFGALGTNLDADAATNSTAIANAIAFAVEKLLPAVYFSRRYAISQSVLLTKPVILRGRGRRHTIIRQTNSSASGVVVTTAAGTDGFLGGLEGITIEAGDGWLSTGGVFAGSGSVGIGLLIRNPKVTWTFKDFAIYNFDYGAAVSSTVGGGGTWGATFDNFDIRLFSGDGLQIDVGVVIGDQGADRKFINGSISNTGYSGSNASSRGLVYGGSGLDFMTNITVLATNTGIVVSPASGNIVGAIYFDQVVSDGNVVSNWVFDGTNDRVSEIMCVNCWSGVTTSGPGVRFVGSHLSGATWEGGTIAFAGTYGVQLSGGDGVSIIGAKISNNSAQSTNTYAGVQIDAGVSGFSLIGNRIGNYYSGSSAQAENIKIAAGGSTDFQIIGNILKSPGSGKAELVNGSNVTNWVIEHNTPLYVNSTPIDTSAQITSDQNNYAIGNAKTLRVSTDAARHITGMAGGVQGRRVSFHNVGTQPLIFDNQSASSSAINRFLIGSALTLGADKQQEWIYDSTSQRWRPASAALADLTTAMFAASVVDTDTTLAANSNSRIPSQAAVKAYADNIIAAADAMVFKAAIDCSTNPNYPAANAGWTYKVGVTGKIGGASGPNVELGDTLYCTLDGSASGTHAAVGANWDIVQVNVDGAVVGPASATNGGFARFSGTSGKLLQDHAATIALGSEVSGVLLEANGGTGDTGTAWTAYTPALTVGSGSLTLASASGRWKKIGKTVFFSINVSITTNGTAATTLNATLPVAAASAGYSQIFACRDEGLGAFLQGRLLSGGSVVTFITSANAYPGANGSSICCTGTYESA